MMFARRLRDGVRYGSITCSVREIVSGEVTDELARRSGFADVDDLPRRG